MSKRLVSYNDKHQTLLITGNKIQSVNKREMQMMNRLNTSCIIRVSLQKETPPVRLAANTQGLVTMSEYLQTVTMTKKLFVCIIRSILNSLEYAESIHFSKDLFVYKAEYAFVNVSDMSVVLTYIPLQPCSLEESITDLFGDIIRCCVFDPGDDNSYISNFTQIIKNKDFSLYILKEYLNFIYDNDLDTIKQDSAETTLNDLVSASGGLKQPDITDKPVNDLVVNEDSAGNVTVFRASVREDRILVCKNNGISIEISKSPFRIGKLLGSSDLRIENHAVSRKHAEIVKEGNNYYIIDYYSKNGTFINERRIQSGVKELLQINDTIRFANEEYQFR